MTCFLDTNVLLRFLVGDVPSQQAQAEKWFQEAEQKKRKIFVSTLIIAEASFVLESVYKQNREKIANALELFVSQEWLDIPERSVLLGLWKWYLAGFHFVDSYLLAVSESLDIEILSFDKKLLSKIGN